MTIILVFPLIILYLSSFYSRSLLCCKGLPLLYMSLILLCPMYRQFRFCSMFKLFWVFFCYLSLILRYGHPVFTSNSQGLNFSVPPPPSPMRANFVQSPPAQLQSCYPPDAPPPSLPQQHGQSGGWPADHGGYY